MKILSRMCTTLDGCVTTSDGWPVQVSFDGWDPAALGFYELQARCDAVVMGRTTFEPAIGAPRWPWGDLAVYVLGSSRPAGTPERVVVEADPASLVAQLRAQSAGGDVHLVGGAKTVETFRALGALDEMHVMVLPIFTGEGRRMTPDMTSRAGLTLVDTRTWPNDVVELTYAVV